MKTIPDHLIGNIERVIKTLAEEVGSDSPTKVQNAARIGRKIIKQLKKYEHIKQITQ